MSALQTARSCQRRYNPELSLRTPQPFPYPNYEIHEHQAPLPNERRSESTPGGMMNEVHKVTVTQLSPENVQFPPQPPPRTRPLIKERSRSDSTPDGMMNEVHKVNVTQLSLENVQFAPQPLARTSPPKHKRSVMIFSLLSSLNQNLVNPRPTLHCSLIHDLDEKCRSRPEVSSSDYRYRFRSPIAKRRRDGANSST
jgi:hypothetical protein